MQRLISLSLITTIAILAFCATAGARDARVALVIGNGGYDFAPLANPPNDARDMAKALRGLGFEVVARIDADKRAMVSAMNEFGQKLQRADVGLFYYAGHGVQVRGENYLIPVKAKVKTESDVEFEGVHAGRILGKMRDSNNKLNIVVLDACRDNPFARSFRSAAHGLARMDAPTGSIIAFATSAGATAADGQGRNGVYTGCLLRHLTRGGLSVQEVFNETGLAVMRETGKTQVPWTSSTPIGKYYLASGSVVATKPTQTGTSRGVLEVTSRPEGAGVYVDGSYRGAAPLTLGGVTPGTVRVEVKKEGYTSGSRTVKVAAGRTATVEFYLDRRAGRLYVQTEPAGARVRILNINPAYQAGIELDPGRYHVEVSRDGYTTETRWVEVAAGEDRNELFRLEWEQAATGKKFTNSIGQEFVWIEPGSFMMGSPGTESERDDDERQHRVTLSRGYYLQTTEVTQGQWRAVMGGNPSRFSSCGDDCPVEHVSWNDVQEFIGKLNRKEGAGRYRLPSEAEWEYAARAGTTTPFAFGKCLSTDEANYNGNYPMPGCSKGQYRQKPVRVGSFRPNAWGLYDMHGNVWEWCQDWYGGYPTGSVTDPTGPSTGSGRVFRGGSWCLHARSCRSAIRNISSPGSRFIYLGFRLACSQVIR